MDTKNIKDFPEILQINDNTRLLGIGNNNVGDGAKITIDRLMSQSISPSENNLLSLDDNNKLFVPKSGEIVFNNPFAFGDFKYSDHVISNLSWLRSNGQRNSGTFYEQYYNWLLALYNGEETIAGISVKSVSDSSATDYDYKIDTSSKEFILPIKTKLASGKAIVGNGMTLGLTDGQNLFGTNIYDNANIGACCGISTDSYGKNIGTSYIEYSTTNRINIGMTTDSTKSGIETDATGLYLYYFVGDVIQGANVIDVVKLEEQISGISNIVSDRIYLKTSYVNGMNGYNIWSNGYCEQWGISSPSVSSWQQQIVTLIKKFKDTNYNVILTRRLSTGSDNPSNTEFLTSLLTSTKTVNTFGYWVSYNVAWAGMAWRACGYLASDQY